MQITVLIHGDNAHRQRIESAVALINGCQSYFRLIIETDAALVVHGYPTNPDRVRSHIEHARPGSYTIAIVEDLLNDNWFSHEYRCSSVITIGDWEQHYAPPTLKSYIMYQVAQALMHFASDLSEEIAMRLVHEPPKGCLFDMSTRKLDIRLGMVAGNLCARCASTLRQFGTDQNAIDAIDRIVNLVRSEALGKPVLLDPRKAFVVMRFTSKDENDNAWRYGIKAGVEEYGFVPERADVRVESRQILDKIFDRIKASRLVIAKVDESNLNVYFELGVAMGLEKDTLLVSENSLVVNLPSDLKNWECLTYDKGDYEQLKAKVSNFLAEKYGNQRVTNC
ncbi:MAG: hypothetical protein ACYC7E_11865 [Armatimonadota bacterium]